MGLVFDNSGARWSYSGFNRFRRRIAQHIGIDLDMMEGFSVEEGQSWKTIKDPIKYFLNHSDCDGHLTPKKCLKIAPRLKELVEQVFVEDFDFYDYKNGIMLAEDMQKTGEANEYLRFC